MSIRESDVGKRGTVFFADGTVRARGKILAHSIVPSVLIETEAGERVWWRHDMGQVDLPVAVTVVSASDLSFGRALGPLAAPTQDPTP